MDADSTRRCDEHNGWSRCCGTGSWGVAGWFYFYVTSFFPRNSCTVVPLGHHSSTAQNNNPCDIKWQWIFQVFNDIWPWGVASSGSGRPCCCCCCCCTRLINDIPIIKKKEIKGWLESYLCSLFKMVCWGLVGDLWPLPCPKICV